jgi:hypothetical protein
MDRESTEGVQASPCRAWGVPNSLLLSRAARGEQKKKEIFGDTPNPSKGLAAPCNPADLMYQLLCFLRIIIEYVDCMVLTRVLLF